MRKLAATKTPPVEEKLKERPLRVEAHSVKLESVPVYITGYGEVKVLNVVSIAPEVSGKIVKIHPNLEVGEIILKDDVLFEIDTRDYYAAFLEEKAAVDRWKNTILRLQKQQVLDKKRLKTLERNRKLARNEFERVQKLYARDGVGTPSKVDAAEREFNSATDQANQLAEVVGLKPIEIKEAKNNLESARARLSLAQTRLERCTVTTPFNGRIKKVTLEVGQYVAPGKEVVTLADDTILEIHVPLDSRDARQWLRFGEDRSQRKTAWFSGLEPVLCQIRWTEDREDNIWQGKLHKVLKFDQQTRTLTVAIRIEAQESLSNDSERLPLVEGMFCSVKIPGRTMRDVVRLPRSAVSYDNRVYIVSDNRLKTVPVTVARVEGEQVFISAGLNAGEMVITSRLFDPLENALLEIVNKNV